MCFNPRTHEGCDLSTGVIRFEARSFNPRTHEGCDMMTLRKLFGKQKFQSTHPRGVRQITKTNNSYNF